jgi:hypothetical protein
MVPLESNTCPPGPVARSGRGSQSAWNEGSLKQGHWKFSSSARRWISQAVVGCLKPVAR